MKNLHTPKESVKKENLYTACIENAAFSVHTSAYVSEVLKKDDPDSFAFHLHRQKEIVYMERGAGILHLEDRSIPISAGTIYCLPELTFHWLEITRDNSTFICLNFTLERLTELPYTKDLYGEFSRIFAENGVTVFRPEAKIAELMTTIGRSPNTISSLPRISELMLGYLEHFKSDPQSLPDTDFRHRSEHVREFYVSNGLDRFFNHCYMNDNSLSELSEALHLSTRQTERCINKLYGMPMRKRMIYIRLVNAAFAVTHTNLSSRTIADRVGFNNYNTFLDAFRSHYGCTPSEYRKKHRNQKD